MGKRPTHETWVKWLLKKVLLWASIGTGVLIVWSLASQWLRSMEAAERSSALRDYFTGQTD
ncbi:MAG: hypothetical protein FWB78_13015, partial [Treponema sp.]|nr:hypothetical protein [Treponema sp.]